MIYRPRRRPMRRWPSAAGPASCPATSTDSRGWLRRRSYSLFSLPRAARCSLVRCSLVSNSTGWDEAAFARVLPKVSVFARVTPAHKLRIVKAL